MERETVQGVTIDRCAGCGRVWLDAGEVDRLLMSTEAVLAVDIGASGPAARGQSLGEVLCPRDLTALEVVRHPEQSHIEVDRCPRCKGMLLDAGELRDMDQFTLLERLKSLIGGKRGG